MQKAFPFGKPSFQNVTFSSSTVEQAEDKNRRLYKLKSNISTLKFFVMYYLAYHGFVLNAFQNIMEINESMSTEILSNVALNYFAIYLIQY